MTRGRKALIGGGVVFAGLIVLLIARPSKPISVEVAPVERGTVEERVSSSASGDVEPKARAVLRAETVARVTKLLAKAGDRVEAGAVLLRLDDQALAAAVAAARVQNETAQRDAQTADAMQKKGIITEQALLAARSAADLAHANLSLAEANLARATVRAPFAGLVTRLPVQEGDSVIVGQSLAEVVDDSALYVRAAFDEVDAVRLRLGLDAMARLDAYPDAPLPARVDRIDPVVGGDTISGGSAADAVALSAGKKDRTVGVRVAIEPGTTLPGGAPILVGMSADVEVVLSTHAAVLRVPSAAIFHEKGQQFAYVLSGGRLHRRTVETGTSNWDFQEVKDGLSEGERVLVSLEAEGIKNGARAIAIPSPSPVTTPGRIGDPVPTPAPSGTLTINGDGWTVVLDGRPMAPPTPLSVPVAAGPHHLELSQLSTGKRHEMEITIAAGLVLGLSVDDAGIHPAGGSLPPRR